MKYIVFLMTVLVLSTSAQRPSYAGSAPIGRPSLASRFQDQNAESTTIGLVNRVGEDGTTAKIPVDARGDNQLVNRLNEWPREHRPFWLINAEHIEASRNQRPGQGTNLAQRGNFGNDGTIPIRPPVQRSPFLPPINRR